MSLPYRPLPTLLLIALLGGASATAFGAPQQGTRKPHQADAQGDRSDSHRHNDDALSDSIRKVERATRGQVLSAERVPYDGRSLNRIKIVDSRGRVRVYMDDPRQESGPKQKSGKRQFVGRPPPPTRDDDD